MTGLPRGRRFALAGSPSPGKEAPMSTVMTPSATARRELSAMEARLIGPEDAAYEDARAVYNAMIDRRPGVIARPTSADEVSQVVRFAREHGLPLAILGVVLNGAVLAPVDDVVVCDL